MVRACFPNPYFKRRKAWRFEYWSTIRSIHPSPIHAILPSIVVESDGMTGGLGVNGMKSSLAETPPLIGIQAKDVGRYAKFGRVGRERQRRDLVFC